MHPVTKLDQPNIAYLIQVLSTCSMPQNVIAKSRINPIKELFYIQASFSLFSSFLFNCTIGSEVFALWEFKLRISGVGRDHSTTACTSRNLGIWYHFTNLCFGLLQQHCLRHLNTEILPLTFCKIGARSYLNKGCL